MLRLAIRLTGPLLLLLMAGRLAWSEPAVPAGGSNPELAPSVPAAGDRPATAPARADSITAAGSPASAADRPAVQVAQAAGDQPAAPANPAPAEKKTAEAPPAAPPAPAAPEAPKPEAPKLDISGFVDAYYEYNFNRPPRFTRDAQGNRVRVDPQNVLRNFDFRHNEFALNLAEVVVKRAPSPVGFQLNLAFGKATDFIHAAEPGGQETYKHILQAFLTVPLRLWGKDDTLDAGIFVTPAGAEVIETKDNWNYTRSLLFAWAIPYYHAGARYHHNFTSTTGLTLFLFNGWNDVEDNNNSPSYGLSFNTNFTKKLAFVGNYIGGPELTDDNHNWRHLLDGVLTYNLTDKTAFVLNADYAKESRDVGSVSWGGVAAYARHQLSARNAVVLRGEWFSDINGASTGTSQIAKEVTLTYEMKGPAGLLTRAEFRYDWSTKNVFINSSGGTKDTQPTFLVGAVYAF